MTSDEKATIENILLNLEGYQELDRQNLIWHIQMTVHYLKRLLELNND